MRCDRNGRVQLSRLMACLHGFGLIAVQFSLASGSFTGTRSVHAGVMGARTIVEAKTIFSNFDTCSVAILV